MAVPIPFPHSCLLNPSFTTNTLEPLLPTNRTSLQAENAKCVERQDLAENKMIMKNKSMESTIHHLREDLVKTAKERDDLLGKEENLVQEQIKILKEMAEDREEMKADLKQYQIDLNTMKTALKAEKERNRHLEDQLVSLKQEQIDLNAMKTALKAEKERNRHLEDQLASLKQEQLDLDDTTTTLQQKKDEKRPLEGQLASLEHQKHSQNQVEQAISESSLRIHELANEKEELEIRVKRLESELQSFKATCSENKYLRMVITIMETKLKKVNADFSFGHIRQQEMESQLKQAKSALAQHAKEFAQAIKCRDAAITDMITMKGQMDAMEEREHQVMNVRRSQLGTSEFNAQAFEIKPLTLYVKRSLEINSILQKIM